METVTENFKGNITDQNKLKKAGMCLPDMEKIIRL